VTTLARTRESFHGVTRMKRLPRQVAGSGIPRLVALVACVPESVATLEVLEIAPTDDNFLRSGPALTRHGRLGLGGGEKVLAKGVKVGC